jgi:hypothetical protein
VNAIAAGMHVPYRTLGDKEEYYIRAGSNFLPTPHAVLAGLFGRVPYPDLQILVSLRSIASIPGKGCDLLVEVSVINAGRGLAEQLFLGVETEERRPNYLVDFLIPVAGMNRWRKDKDSRVYFTMISNSFFPALPPNSENVVLTIRIEFRNPPPEMSSST